MNRYHVITHKTQGRHLNVRHLLPASCRLITGLAIHAIANTRGDLQEAERELSFPQALITRLLNAREVSNLFYSYLRTRENEAESQNCFEQDFLPVIRDVLCHGIDYDCLDNSQQNELSDRLSGMMETGLCDHLYNTKDLFKVGQSLTNTGFRDFIRREILQYLYLQKENIFTHTRSYHKQPDTYDCGTITLLVNGNNFLLRDYILAANRELKSIEKELIPFHEPLEVNASLQSVFKCHKDNQNRDLIIRIYIRYEHK